MEEQITLTFPASWVEGPALDQDDLRQALRLGLELIRRQEGEQEINRRVVEALVSTGRIRHFAGLVDSGVEIGTEEPRQVPPTIAGTPVSEVLIAQRR